MSHHPDPPVSADSCRRVIPRALSLPRALTHNALSALKIFILHKKNLQSDQKNRKTFTSKSLNYGKLFTYFQLAL